MDEVVNITMASDSPVPSNGNLNLRGLGGETSVEIKKGGRFSHLSVQVDCSDPGYDFMVVVSIGLGHWIESATLKQGTTRAGCVHVPCLEVPAGVSLCFRLRRVLPTFGQKVNFGQKVADRPSTFSQIRVVLSTGPLDVDDEAPRDWRLGWNDDPLDLGRAMGVV